MNKFITTDNGGLPIHLDDFRFIDDSVRNVLKGIMSAYGIAADESFILSGAGSTLNGPNFDIAAGYISLEGEVLEVEAHSITTTLGGGESHVWKLKTANDPAGLKTFESTSSFDTYQIRQAEVIVETPVGVFMPMLAPSIHERMAINGFGTILQTKLLDIGDWDMDTDSGVSVPHGLATGVFRNIRNVEVIIRDDADAIYTPLDGVDILETEAVMGGVSGITFSSITLQRRATGKFDDTDYDSTSYNRGFVKIEYTL